MTTKKVLIVDEEERIHELVQACLEELGGWATPVFLSSPKDFFQLSGSAERIALQIMIQSPIFHVHSFQ